jgi:hypothetical protein
MQVALVNRGFAPSRHGRENQRTAVRDETIHVVSDRRRDKVAAGR